MIGPLADVLGAGIGNMIGNPLTAIAGLIISKSTPRMGRFWVQFAVAAFACLGVQLGLERMEGLPSYSAPFWLAVEFISIAFWTLIFGVARKLLSRRDNPQEADWAPQDGDY